MVSQLTVEYQTQDFRNRCMVVVVGEVVEDCVNHEDHEVHLVTVRSWMARLSLGLTQMDRKCSAICARHSVFCRLVSLPTEFGTSCYFIGDGATFDSPDRLKSLSLVGSSTQTIMKLFPSFGCSVVTTIESLSRLHSRWRTLSRYQGENLSIHAIPFSKNSNAPGDDLHRMDLIAHRKVPNHMTKF